MTEPVEAVFTYTREEYTRAMRRQYLATRNGWIDVAVGVAILAMGICFLALDLAESWMSWMAIATPSVLLLMVVCQLTLVRQWIYRSQPSLKWGYRLTFSDDGIHFVTDSLDSQIRWSMYDSWRQDDEFYYLHHGPRDLSVIPKRVLRGDADERLEALLNRHLSTAFK